MRAARRARQLGYAVMVCPLGGFRLASPGSPDRLITDSPDERRESQARELTATLRPPLPTFGRASELRDP